MDILVLLGCHWDSRRRCNNRLRAVLVPGLSDWVASLAVVLLLLGLNLATVKMFGEMEFWFAMIKIVAIVALILIGLGMVLMHFESPTGSVASFSNLWNDGGWFPKGLSGFFAGFQIAVFAFVGIELVGTTAAETKDPEKSLPRAINSIPIRIIMFYVFALIMIMSVTPWALWFQIKARSLNCSC